MHIDDAARKPLVLMMTGLLGSTGTSLAQEVCGALTAGMEFPSARLEQVTAVAAGTAPGLPAYCEVDATITAEPGSATHAVFRLPAQWNGKVLGLGGGGFAGNLGLNAATNGLARGYATIQNDMGHPSPNALDPAFTLLPDGRPNLPGLVDFGHRATHLATTLGKAVATARYGRAPEFAYWQGCSTGGRQGLAEVQRYPDDYDGVIAGAPVYTPLTYSNAILRVQAFHGAPGSNLLPEHVPLIGAAVQAACDANDAVRDGIINDPRTCTWDPAELACAASPANPTECLSPAQVETVRQVYTGVRTAAGQWAAMPLMRGGESDWATRMIGNPGMPLGLNARLGAPFVSFITMADPDYDLLSFDPEQDLARLAGGVAGTEIHATQTAIAPFIDNGGKLLLWHGFNDPGPSALSTIEYYEGVLADTPGAAASTRLFLLPGVLHCSGGAGPDQFDALSAIEAWVEGGAAPERIIASKADGSLTRPLCAYPALPAYNGRGSTTAADSFSCAAPGAD